MDNNLNNNLENNNTGGSTNSNNLENSNLNFIPNQNINAGLNTSVNQSNINMNYASNSNINANNNGANQSISNTEVLTTLDNSSSSAPSVETLESKDNLSSGDVEYVYTPPSKSRYVFLIMVFIMLMALVYFLPNITEYVALKQAEKNQVNEEFSDGSLVCSLKKTGTDLDIVYDSVFAFSDNKLDKLIFTTTTKGDQSLDYDTFDREYKSCTLLSEETINVSGVSVTCDLNTSSVVVKQSINYNLLDLDQVTSAYVEAGGVFPNFESGEDIYKIERQMNASGYTCERCR